MTGGFHEGELAVQRRAGVGRRGTRLHVHTSPAEGDPLQGLPGGQHIDLLAIEFARRRRVRVNGALIGAGGDGLTVAVEQAYGNCPKYTPAPRCTCPAPRPSSGPRRVNRATTAVPAVASGSPRTASCPDRWRCTPATSPATGATHR
jgi:hypothetical protein